MNVSIPDGVAFARESICQRCVSKCDEHKAYLIDYADPGASCPRGVWGRHTASALPSAQQAPLWLKAKRLSLALWEWIKYTRGRWWLGIVSAGIFTRRRSICQQCGYWKSQGNWLLGECQAPSCGCSKLKLWLITSKCPHPEGNKWGIEVTLNKLFKASAMYKK